ncbi:mannose-1-phosphate guanylyltransferase/mannose-6-phosphate isomerase [Clostridium kluyveri]|uniref:mannose-1-phosphate guanylyltransferase/mannose-6-phosphate isomerase n=1 Tax=Clostridium kluyveri TaxID=1534 RepID=UPI0022484971|nr:mannose-1-phosphate guanylyltransferase/mannose-6-phosphate isomerase [Clostridium kluyveri]UZQ50347.1 mannose-1-phosphate guanylyltransferase/mannose-6-phosphate isomerase [Clostridium kluyveri]
MKVIILAGGSGTRLWPLSRGRYPKQFIKLRDGKTSLFQETFKRSLLLADLSDVYVVTNEKYKFLVIGAIEELGYKYNESNVIVEPEAKNTLPAIYAGIHGIAKKGSDSVVIFPSDHMILKNLKFAHVIVESEALTKDSIVTFGIKPDRANTGYGYISPGNKKLNGYQVDGFKEKPECEIAATYIDEGCYWNSGIFMVNTEFFINEVKQYAPNIYNAFESSDTMKEAFSKIDENISIDYGIMEKSKNVTVAPVDIGWNDLGSFDAFFNTFDKDENNNIVNSDNIVIDSNNNYIYSEEGKIVSIIAVNDLVVVDNRDALLICRRDQSQKVKKVVETLKLRNDSRVEYHVEDYRPWGNYKILEEEKNLFKIKRIKVSQGKRLSYQMHCHRSEHWIVVKGMARITIDSVEKLVPSGESIFIRPGQKHRLENIGKTSLEIIEVQMGDYLEENDIVRFDDEYGRV